MYKSFRVKNFRCFKDLQINDLGRVNLIAGKNNTGKTALLEAMYVFSRPFTPQTHFHLQQQVRALQAPDINLPVYWQQLFRGMDTQREIEYFAEYSTNVFSRERMPNPSDAKLSVIEITDSDENRSEFELYRKRLNRPESVQESLDRMSDGERILMFKLYWENQDSWRPLFFSADLLNDRIPYVKEPSRFVPVHGRPNNEQIADELSQIQIAEKLPHLVKVLQMIEAQITDLRVLSPYGERMIWAQLDRTQVPLRLLGEGTNRFAHFIMTMLAVKPPYLFIDEIENGIHHSVQCKVWQAIGQVARELDIQVFATTHSYEMIQAAHEAFKDDEKDDFRFHRLYHDSTTGKIEARTYSEFSVEAAVSREYEVRG